MVQLDFVDFGLMFRSLQQLLLQPSLPLPPPPIAPVNYSLVYSSFVACAVEIVRFDSGLSTANVQPYKRKSIRMNLKRMEFPKKKIK